MRVRIIFLTGWEIDGVEKNADSKSGELFTSAEFHLEKFLHPFRSYSYTTSWQILMNPRGLLMSASRVMGKLWRVRPRRARDELAKHFYFTYSIVFKAYLPKSWQNSDCEFETHIMNTKLHDSFTRPFRFFKRKFCMGNEISLTDVTEYPWARYNKKRNHFVVCHFNSFSVKSG